VSPQKVRKAVTYGTTAVAAVLAFNSAVSACDTEAPAAAAGSDIPNIIPVIKAVLPMTNPAAAGGSPNNNKGAEMIERLIEQYSGQINELGMSGLLGVCSGMALKKIGKNAAVIVGTVFVMFQAFQRLGYIDINMKKVTKDLSTLADVDGDGKFDEKDVMLMWQRLKSMLEENMPSAASYGTGFGIGFYLG